MIRLKVKLIILLLTGRNMITGDPIKAGVFGIICHDLRLYLFVNIVPILLANSGGVVSHVSLCDFWT